MTNFTTIMGIAVAMTFSAQLAGAACYQSDNTQSGCGGVTPASYPGYYCEQVWESRVGQYIISCSGTRRLYCTVKVSNGKYVGRGTCAIPVPSPTPRPTYDSASYEHQTDQESSTQTSTNTSTDEGTARQESTSSSSSSSSRSSSSSSSSTNWTLIAIIGGSALGGLLLLICIIYCCCCRKKGEEKDAVGNVQVRAERRDAAGGGNGAATDFFKGIRNDVGIEIATSLAQGADLQAAMQNGMEAGMEGMYMG